jgi:hypothetical protein
MQVVYWQETISRGLVKALMGNFTSVADALKELVDNAIDYRWGQKLSISISYEREKDRVIVESDGGRGMGAEEIAVWLNWGEGEQHSEDHIGRWHQGGKAACGFLARHVRLWAKRKGDDRVWFFEDEDWAVRSEPKDFGTPQPLSPQEYPDSMRGLPKDRGHVRIELTKLNKHKRWNLEVLKRDLSSTYRTLIEKGEVTITINGDEVPPLEIPLSTATRKIDINVRLRKRHARGWAGRVMRSELTYPLKAGLRLIHSGRVIREGEWFGYNYEGKGALNSLIGELHLYNFTPNPNKTDFLERSEEVWEELGRQVIEQLKPLIANLRRAGEESRVSKAEKERAREVADELERAFAALEEVPPITEGEGEGRKSWEAGPGGRKPPSPRLTQPAPGKPRGPDRQPRKPRSPPPLDAVGSLVRLLEKVTGGKRRPPLRIRSWEASVRFAWTNEGAQTFLDINKNFPLYKALNGAKAYIAETAILALCKPVEGESMSVGDYLEKVHHMTLKWAEVAGLIPSEKES